MRRTLLGFLAAITILGVSDLGNAQVTYTYTGNPLTYFLGAYSCTAGVGQCAVSGSFTVPAPLPANLNLPESNPYVVTPLSFSFTDGVLVLNQSNAPCGYACTGPEFQILATDGQGLPTAWILQIQTGGFYPRYEIGTDNFVASNACCVYDSAYHYNASGNLDAYAANGNDTTIAGGNGLGVPGAWTVSGIKKYNVCLLYDPTKAVNSGSTLPIKLQLCDASGNDLSSSTITLHATSITQTSSSISGPVQDSGNANPDNDFRFDSTLGTTGGYIFNLSTKGLSTGTYNLNFTVTGDSFGYAVSFQVK